MGIKEGIKEKDWNERSVPDQRGGVSCHTIWFLFFLFFVLDTTVKGIKQPKMPKATPVSPLLLLIIINSSLFKDDDETVRCPRVRQQQVHRLIIRINRELADLAKEELGGMTLQPNDANLFEWKATIPGPQGSVYEGGLFHVDIVLPDDYPFVHLI